MSTRLVRYVEDGTTWLAVIGPSFTSEENIVVTIARKDNSADPNHLKAAADYVNDFGLHIVESCLSQVRKLKALTIDSSAHRPHDRIGLVLEKFNDNVVDSTIQVLWACLDWPSDSGLWCIEPAADAHRLLRLHTISVPGAKNSP